MRVFAATSVIDAFQDIADAFHADHPDLEVELTFGTSAELVDLVDHGAAAAVLATGDPEVMGSAVDQGLARFAHPFARNRLAIAVSAGNPKGIRTIDDLGRDGISVALCHPSLPCGALGGALLDRVGVEWESTDTGRSGRAVLARVAAGVADVGIAWTTDFEGVDGVEAVPIEGADGIEESYEISVLSSAVTRDEAELFVAFVLGPDGRAILTDHDFLDP